MPPKRSRSPPGDQDLYGEEDLYSDEDLYDDPIHDGRARGTKRRRKYYPPRPVPIMTRSMAKSEADIIGDRSTVNVNVRPITMPGTFTIQIPPSIIVEQLKVFVKHRTGVPVEDQRLLLCGQQLDDHRTFESYNATPDAILYMVMRLRGS
ncbi:hypothetical protein PRZ48_008047 [Zasmidium cellare]|uniref:Ubiquitin-like domain-containing protein n=1 Tax=Zasmidium cellare TaxID=395010 RepID=A0ABR0EED5_ZASCE|nr:hypothetical protein PRZ48_008047 [Zasmidium cellare]